MNEKNKAVALPLFTGKETISGTVVVTVPKGKKYEHLGIKIELVGQIGTFHSQPLSTFYAFRNTLIAGLVFVSCLSRNCSGLFFPTCPGVNSLFYGAKSCSNDTY